MVGVTSWGYVSTLPKEQGASPFLSTNIVPLVTEWQVLYYRKDLLEAAGEQPPKSWAELSATAQELQDKARAEGNDRMWGYVFQGKAYEGLTCNGLEWVDSFGGGTIVDADGAITVDNEKAAAALTWVASTVGTIVDSPFAFVVILPKPWKASSHFLPRCSPRLWM